MTPSDWQAAPDSTANAEWNAPSMDAGQTVRPRYQVRLGDLEATAHRELRQFEIRHESALQEFSRIWQTMTDASPFVMARALFDLGYFKAANEVLTAESISGRTAFPHKYRALMYQWLQVLAEQGLVRANHDEVGSYSTTGLDIHRAQRCIDRALESVSIRTAYPGFVEFFKACLGRQTELLLGTANPQKLLFPSGSLRLVEGLYRTNPAAASQNSVVAAVVEAAYRAADHSRPFRILEVGAGTGATTAAVVARLPRGRIDYAFTDISRFFLKRAMSEFRGFVGMTCGVLDIDRPPTEQGFDAHSFDVLLAGNALHTARDIDRTLRYLRGLLSDTGILVAVETTTNTALQMVTFGHFDGVCHFEDDRRRSNLPFLSAAEWRLALQRAGFQWSTAIPERQVSNAWTQHVLLSAHEVR